MIQTNKWALVTGASSGIGKELCFVLAQKGYNIVLVARRVELMEKIQITLKEKYNVKTELVKADLCERADRERVVTYFSKFNISFLVNNAGVMLRGKFDEQEPKIIHQMIELNLIALTHLTHESIKYFKTKTDPCFILNVGSVNSYVTAGESAIYCGTKSFVKTLSVALAEELKGTNITCSCLCPGGTESEILDVAGLSLSKNGEKFMMKADRVARLGVDSALSGKLIEVPGFSNKLTVLFSRIIPERMMTSISSKVLKSLLK